MAQIVEVPVVEVPGTNRWVLSDVPHAGCAERFGLGDPLGQGPFPEHCCLCGTRTPALMSQAELIMSTRGLSKSEAAPYLGIAEENPATYCSDCVSRMRAEGDRKRQEAAINRKIAKAMSGSGTI